MEKTILYVDDEPFFVQSLVQALIDEGYIVDQVRDGTQAIESVEKSIPNLIVMDIIMPTGNKIPNTNGVRRTGWHAYLMLRKELKIRIPIIFVTVVDDPELHRQIQETEKSLGLFKYAILVKPVLPTELLEQVEKFIVD